MKRIFKWMTGALMLTVLLIAAPHQKAKAQPGVSVSFQMFYDELSPYGQWIDDPQYGYVWAPHAGNDFRPYYTNGRWVMTEYGNTWISNYNWGWAPFHYGRWTYDSFYGWVWIPGDEWGPAWVGWRSGGGYYGWAPLGPGININISIGNYHMPYDWWTFVPYRHIYASNYHSYWRGASYNTTIINQTTIINNYYNNRYAYGPRRNDVERYTGRVKVYDIRNEQRPSRASLRRNEVALYRPNIVKNERGNAHRAAPEKVVRAKHSIGNGNYRDSRSAVNRNAPVRQTRENAATRNNAARQAERNNHREAQQQRTRAAEIRTRHEQQQAERKTQIERQRAARENTVRTQKIISQRQNQQRIQQQRQQANRNERMQQAQRANEKRMEDTRARQRVNEQRRQNVQRQRQQPQRMQERRTRAPQREWRRPEPQRQRVERPQMQRQHNDDNRQRPGGRGR